jgi:hypothetical protein
MSDLYDVYKEEAIRLLTDENTLVNSVRQHIGTLRATFCPAVQIEAINQRNYRTWEKFVITIAGTCNILDDHRSTLAHYEECERNRRQRRWVVRKLKDYGKSIGADSTCVSTNHGSVYFSYHLIIEHASHLTE